jgi:hypothetical protein
MVKKINDEFSDLPISKQRKWQLRKFRDGKCQICGDGVIRFGSWLCKAHLLSHRKYERATKGWKPRTKNGKGRPQLMPD